MKSSVRRLTSILLLGCLAGTSQAVVIQSEPIQINPASKDDLWAYSYLSSNTAINNSAYYTTTAAEYAPAVFQGYVVGDQHPTGTVDYFSSHDGSQWQSDFQTTHVFETYLKSSIAQTVSLAAGGDDGHSIFVDDVFYAGAGYAVTALANFSMAADVAYKISLILDNYTGGWSTWFSVKGDYDPNTQIYGWAGPASEAQNISMNAVNSFVTTAPVPTPEPTALALIGLGLAGIGFTRRKYHA